ncbi:hypothetical protein DR871_014320 [Flavobacterium petrolei]|uniref:Uncharacterized protein n=1 Tax=Flavobacterium petrolei TaxID=2259594 RepID=A0A482TIB3_9FLAO|nr:hypothetical protein [Flavobacterium petrolei]RYJ51093.1 hypothetical protein DR871_014320 [Flavobacterium petrolei]
MNDKELKIIFLKRKLESESKKLNRDDFFELIKDEIGWRKYNEINSESVRNSLLDAQTHTKLTELGKSTLSTLESDVKQEFKDKEAVRKKLHNDSKLSDWQVKTFWFLFVFGIFGGLYSGYDIIKNLTKEENVKSKQITKEEMESELSKLRTLILSRKKDSSSIPPNPEKGK